MLIVNTGLIVKPTPEQMTMPLKYAVIGNNLDPAIEEQVIKDRYFISAHDLTQATLERAGISRADRGKVFELCLDAVLDLGWAVESAAMKASGIDC